MQPFVELLAELRADGLLSLPADDPRAARVDAMARTADATTTTRHALMSISGWSACQCRQVHGDNPDCAVLVAERALSNLGGVIHG